MLKTKFLIIVTCAFLLSACFPSNNTAKQELLLQGKTMGTTYSIKVVVPETFSESKDMQKDIDQLLIQLNDEMSTYIDSSELSKFNRATNLEPISASVGLTRVLKEAIRLGQLSSGKLDVTVGPLVNLWGFGPEYRPETVPTDAELNETRKKIGLSNLVLDGNQLSKKIPNLYIDLSTIAKGYGVDIVAEYLEQQGYVNYLVEIGGEMRLKGFKRTGELWHIAIEKPVTNERAMHQLIIPKDNAVATSGDYRNYYEVDGKRFSHIIDPDTGKPIDHKMVSVTVIHPSSMTADGLSTAMMVMGPEKALAFAEENGIAAYLISKSDHGFVEQSSVKFMQYLK